MRTRIEGIVEAHLPSLPGLFVSGGIGSRGGRPKMAIIEHCFTLASTDVWS